MTRTEDGENKSMTITYPSIDSFHSVTTVHIVHVLCRPCFAKYNLCYTNIAELVLSAVFMGLSSSANASFVPESTAPYVRSGYATMCVAKINQPNSTLLAPCIRIIFAAGVRSGIIKSLRAIFFHSFQKVP